MMHSYAHDVHSSLYQVKKMKPADMLCSARPGKFPDTKLTRERQDAMDSDQTAVFAGSRHMRVRDDIKDMEFRVLVHYPTRTASTPTAFGPYVMDVSVDAPLSQGHYPLVMISHGNGGSHLLYRTISTHLAKNGYIVASVEHYGNNRDDNRLENTTDNLINRPRHVMLAIDEILSNQRFCSWVEKDRIGIIGHSMGGYTALALAGGVPRTREGQIVDAPSDSRIKALVLLAPGAGWFMNSLDKVTMPILMLTAEHDHVTPGWNADIVLAGVPDQSQVTFMKVENAGHFSFLSPFPEPMRNSTFLPSTDPDGFDRGEFHNWLPPIVRRFLDEKLK
jgi:predicted dienelactone hydrolase